MADRKHRMRQVAKRVSSSTSVFLRDTGHGLLEVCHNSLALLGLCLAAALLFAATRADLRHDLEQQALAWLVERQEARAEGSESLADLAEPRAVDRATAADPRELPRQQAAVATWLSRRYKVAPEPVSRLVQEAWSVGYRLGVEPTLVLAVMAVESSFNPFAQSPVGAQGLMQVMTRVHNDKYEAFGGIRAAFDPITNLRVGVQILKECITRGGGLEAGLRAYVGAAISGQDGGYVVKVLAEQVHLRQVADGKPVSVNAALPAAAKSSLAVETADRIIQPAGAASAVAPTLGVERVALLD